VTLCAVTSCCLSPRASVHAQAVEPAIVRRRATNTRSACSRLAHAGGILGSPRPSRHPRRRTAAPGLLSGASLQQLCGWVKPPSSLRSCSACLLASAVQPGSYCSGLPTLVSLVAFVSSSRFEAIPKPLRASQQISKNKRVSMFGDQHSPGVVRETAGRRGQGHHESMTQRCKKLFFSLPLLPLRRISRPLFVCRAASCGTMLSGR
jgi:hypothetical protein